MVVEDSTGTRFRLTRDEAMLVRFGLLRVGIAHRKWKDAGQDMIPPGSCTPLPAPADPGRYSADHQAMILHVVVTATSSFQAHSRRLRMNALELADRVLGVRATEMMCRHGHLAPCLKEYKVRARLLLKKLERLRKRAKRAYSRGHGPAAFAEASQIWQQHVRFVRRFFLYCSCNRFKKWVKGARAVHKLVVNDWMKFFHEELTALELTVPPEPKLRDLVRRALRGSQRALRVYGRSYFHDRPGVLQERIRLFVVNRCLKSEMERNK